MTSQNLHENNIILKKVLLSINPRYIRLIEQEKKKWEYRKRIWSNHKLIHRIYVYETSPTQKIIGYFTSNLILKGDPRKIWDLTFNEAGISQNEFKNYFSTKEIGYALQISNFHSFEDPLDPYKLIEKFTPPQNFMYLNLNLKRTE